MNTVRTLSSKVRTWGNTAEPTMEHQPNPYVHTALLDAPAGTLLIRELWKPRSVLGELAVRLREQSKTLRSVVEDAAQSNGSVKRVPSSVLLELPESFVAHDRRTGGHFIGAMASELAGLHQNDLASLMEPGAQARYKVMPAVDLPANKMRVRLGSAIYVPQANELPAWRVEISLNGADWDALEPVELFENQRLFILSGSANHGSRACPEWPFKASVGLVMLNQPGDTELEFSAEPLPSLEVRHNSEAGWTVVRESGTDGACLYLKTTRLLKINTTPEPVVNAEHARIEPHANDWPEKPLAQCEPPKPVPVTAETDTRTTDPASSAFDIEPTRVQRASAAANWDTEPTHVRQAPQREARMALRGLAVQKLSLYTSDGIKGLQWALDARGHLVRADAPGALHRFDLMPTDELRLLTRNGHRTLKHGDSLPLEAGRTMSHWQPLPDSLSNAYLGWLSLPQSPSASLVVGDEFTVGRMHPALTSLRPLSKAGKVLAPAGEGADRLGLSRHHAKLCLTSAGVEVTAIQGDHGLASVAHLDDNMGFLAWIGADKPVVLQPGQHLLLAHYVWRFEA